MLLGLVALLLGLGFMGTSSSVDEEQTAPAQDMQTMAERDLIMVEEATALYGWHNDFALLVQEVERAAPGSVAHARAGEIWFKDGIPAAAQIPIDSFEDDSGVDVTLDIHKGYKQEDITKAVTAIHLALRNDSDVRDAATGFDSASGRIVSEVQLENVDSKQTTLMRLGGVAKSKLHGLTSQVPVEVKEMDYKGPLLIDLGSTKHWGGEGLKYEGDPECTTGFVVSDGNNQGISTAAHCEDDLTDDHVALDMEGQCEDS